MKRIKRFLQTLSTAPQRGSMLVELLLSVALAVLVIPYIFQYQQDAIIRAENISVVRQMSAVQTSLERYIVENREALLQAVGKNITRIKPSDLAEYGLPETVLQNADKYQLRILKSTDTTGSATLQGVVVFTDSSITPIRTRQIVNLSGGSMGFVEDKHAWGGFGTWHNNTIDMGINSTDGLVDTTTVHRDNALYLWRVPSADSADATMMTALNLGGHDIANAKFFDAYGLQTSDTLTLSSGVVRDMIFQNRPTIDSEYTTTNATVAGGISADGRSMNVAGTLTMADVGKFSSFTTGDLWVRNLTLSGVSVDAYDENYRLQPAILNVSQSLDMTSGHVDAIYTTVSFTGSVTPRLVVSDLIQDSRNSDYYWDVNANRANFADVSLAELSRLATLVAFYEKDASTSATQIFGAVSANKNATASDYLNAIDKIAERVREKYRMLKL